MAKEQGIVPTSADAPTALERFKQALSQEAELNASFEDGDGESIAEQIMEKMLLAENLEDAIALQDAGLTSAQDIVDFEHEVIGFEVVQSTKEGGVLKYYLRVSAIAEMAWEPLKLNPGDEFTYAVGASNPVTILFKARSTGRLPLSIFYREKATTGDKSLLLLRLVPKRAK